MSRRLSAELRVAGACFAFAASLPVCGLALELAGQLTGFDDIRTLPVDGPGFLFCLVFAAVALLGASLLLRTLSRSSDHDGVPMSKAWCCLLVLCAASPFIEEPIRRLSGEAWRLRNVAFVSLVALSSFAFIQMLRHVSQSSESVPGRRQIALRQPALFLLATLTLPTALLLLDLQQSAERLQRIGASLQRGHWHTYIMSVYYLSTAVCIMRFATRVDGAASALAAAGSSNDVSGGRLVSPAREVPCSCSTSSEPHLRVARDGPEERIVAGGATGEGRES